MHPTDCGFAIEAVAVKSHASLSSRTTTLFIFLTAAAGARVVAVGLRFAFQLGARGECVDAVQVQVGQHRREFDDDAQAFFVAQRGGFRG